MNNITISECPVFMPDGTLVNAPCVMENGGAVCIKNPVSGWQVVGGGVATPVAPAVSAAAPESGAADDDPNLKIGGNGDLAPPRDDKELDGVDPTATLKEKRPFRVVVDGVTVLETNDGAAANARYKKEADGFGRVVKLYGERGEEIA